jgi:hypothetical protein
MEADLAKSFLDANGIHALIAADDAGGMFPNLGTGVGIFVLKEDAEEARELLQEAQGQEGN